MGESHTNKGPREKAFLCSSSFAFVASIQGFLFPGPLWPLLTLTSSPYHQKWSHRMLPRRTVETQELKMK